MEERRGLLPDPSWNFVKPMHPSDLPEPTHTFSTLGKYSQDRSRRSKLLLATALSGCLLMMPGMMSSARAVDVTNTNGDNSPGSLGAALESADKYVTFQNAGTSVVVNLASDFSTTTSKVFSVSGNNKNIEIGGGNILLGASISFTSNENGVYDINSRMSFLGMGVISVSDSTVNFHNLVDDINTIYINNATISLYSLSSPENIESNSSNGKIIFKNSGIYSSNGKYDIQGAFYMDTSGNDVSIGAKITGSYSSGSIVKVGLGTLTLTEANDADGTIEIQEGTLSVSGDNNLTSGAVKLNGGDLEITGQDTIDNNIVLQTSGTITNSQAVTLSGILSGTGAFTKAGSGALTLTGSNTHSGTTTITDGSLIVNGSAGDITVDGGTLGGSGTVGNVTVNSGGTLAPGNSIGRLVVNGGVGFTSAAIYEVEVDGNGNSDKIEATGSVSIDSGATVTVSAENGTDDGSTYAPSTTYTIITANGGVSGTFGSVNENFAFLDAFLSYDAKNVYLKLLRNNFTFSSLAETPNQTAIADVLDTMGNGNSVHDAVLTLSSADTLKAFDDLSGDVYGTTDNLLIQNTRFARNAVGDRIRGAFGSVASGNDQMLLAFHGEGEASNPADGTVAWGSAYGSWGQMKANATSAGMEHVSGGAFMGLDTAVFDNWRVGLFGGYGTTNFDSSERSSSGDAKSYSFGAYAGGQFGPLGARLGANITLQDVDMTRRLKIGSLNETLEADYLATTTQAFGEIGYSFETEFATLEPFAGASLIHQHTPKFSETGGSAALTSSAKSKLLGTTRLGLRAERGFKLKDDISLNLQGSFGWEHVIGDLTSPNTMRFSSGNAFKVSGTPMDRDVATIGAGLSLSFTDKASLDLSYDAQLSNSTQTHGLNARFSASF